MKTSFKITDPCLKLTRCSIHILYFDAKDERSPRENPTPSEGTQRNSTISYDHTETSDLDSTTRTQATTRPSTQTTPHEHLGQPPNSLYDLLSCPQNSNVIKCRWYKIISSTYLHFPYHNLYSLGGDAWINFDKWTTSLISSGVNMLACSKPINSCCLEFPTKLFLKNDGRPPCLSRMI